ncbi:hypothetical protein AB0425_32370 [Actinosynnema sp. NPDC051121]
MVDAVDGGEAELESDLVDLTEVDLQQLGQLPRTALWTSLQRILLENRTPTEQYASFQSRI